MRNLNKIVFAGILTASLSLADTLTLKNGENYQGTYLGGTARQIRMDLNGEIRTFDLSQVRSVSFDNSADAPPPRYQNNRDQASSRDQEVPRMRRAVDPNQASNQPSFSSPSPSNGGSLGVTLDAGTSITVRMIDPVDSETARIGQTFRASIDEPVMSGDRAVIPRGADVLTKLVADQKSGKISGSTVLTLAIMNITVNGQPVDVTTSDVQTASASRGKKSAGVIGGGTALGAIIGGLAGGGRGAAIGAASGAAAGTGVQVLTDGQKVKIPSETRLTFRLQNPVAL